ncbi:MAG: cytochrome c oxidase accessory protein CcoG [Flavobacteriales bacterium]|nr:cytochrome c oxidase accessory protein CcoG [Flavobacteriales bacterium]
MTSSGEAAFRDRLSTLDAKGSRKWIYPKKIFGKYFNARTWLSYVLLVLMFTGPFLRIGGEPVLMFNILERKFIIFGKIFWPQDFYLFGLATVTLIVFVILFTVVFGRLFCGWVCPQTIFMEMLFRRIEYWIEGDWKHQQKLDSQKWDWEKIRKKGLKHFLFFGISFIIANTFLAYIIGSDQLIDIITSPPTEHMAGLVAILVFTYVFYGVFAKMREQVCTNICPYGRLQGVLLDRNSMIVAYDHKRGEGRSMWRNKEDRRAAGKGDCIDCHQCVDVCPTGIDIRNGTQLECINCTACMDACDHVMTKVGLPTALIGYKSEESINTGVRFRYTARMIAYTVVLTILVGVMTALIVTRADVGATLLRTPGMIFQEHDGQVSNLYNYKIINKTGVEMQLELRLLQSEGTLRLIGELPATPPAGVTEGALFIDIPRSAVQDRNTKVTIGIYSEGKLVRKMRSSFIGPIPGTHIKEGHDSDEEGEPESSDKD